MRRPLRGGRHHSQRRRDFFGRSRKWLTWLHLKVLNAILRCRTAALGGHVDACTVCGHRAAISYNSCRNRHCPKCQANARDRWLEARAKELLPTRYVHVVFTLPRHLAALALQNRKREIYALCSGPAPTRCWRSPAIPSTSARRSASSASFTPGTRNSSIIRTFTVSFPQAVWLWTTRGGSIAAKVLPSGGCTQRRVSGQVCRRPEVCLANASTLLAGELSPLRIPRSLRVAASAVPLSMGGVRKTSVRRPEHALRYLGQYTHRVAISNHRSSPSSMVRSRFAGVIQPTTIGKKRLMTLPVNEFLRRFLLHLLPRGFVRIRHFGFLANRRRATLLPRCFAALHATPPKKESETSTAPTAHPLWRCPKCGGPMAVVERFTAAQLQLRSPPLLATAA